MSAEVEEAEWEEGGDFVGVIYCCGSHGDG